MRFIDHWHIIVSIANCHRKQASIVLLYHFYNVSFLFGRDSAANYCFTCFTYLNEVLSELYMATDCCKSFILYNYYSSLTLLHQLLVPLNPNLWAELSDILFLAQLIKGVIFLDQLARRSNIFRCFKLVTGQHPYLDLSPLEVMDYLWYIFLQAIFNCCCTKKCQIAFKLAINCFKTLFFLEKYLFSLAQLKLEIVNFWLIEYFHGEV